MTTAPTPRRRSSALDIPDVPYVPWSVLGPDFIAQWGRPRGKTMPEHVEILGPNGSGKSMLKRDMLLERARRKGTAIVCVVTKQADSTAESFGWPIVDDWRGMRKHDQCVFWPRTKKLGKAREAFQAERVEDLMHHLWQADANTVIDFDEAVWIQDLSDDLKHLLNQYLREGRSHGLTCVLGKQRVQGIQRDMHSETDWKFAFKMNDRNDNERLAELFGNKREWLPVVESLDREKFQFLAQHKLTSQSYISWVDKPVRAHQQK